ncbi:unnamed protein product [Meloidogyne enterolobii]|uniref:Uncharacterized protein n=1 Tax=Meloidogyne enterolobii TaxID=390850 RepID=A0ACB1AGA8_MELEN
MGQTVSHQYGGIYGPDPQMTYCPKCGEYTLTRVTYVMGPLAICMVLMFAFIRYGRRRTVVVIQPPIPPRQPPQPQVQPVIMAPQAYTPPASPPPYPPTSPPPYARK